ncbi:F0F1 ATP synthase subunit B family protein [Varunaivibrio sulfuroxidans]|uniref:ATP synthase subunit b n=1 Tax=Varunaivibrio sulfuroxidans TaxID=1773489 RepID=A0A4R3J9X0_9PROT|nr:F0F1 ATP synthase subunit B [Varunaivibrio sulfuroxidans]TCS62205.1 F-type H+-transporting ATPase subunit b [Varunaivibrio sulfuroxidans]WES30630.1 F0F1 ATP synthase subunit B [Varunaivibrio sulfuroxidans]
MEPQAAAGAIEHSEPFFHSPEFWVAVAFVILIALFGKKVFVMIVGGLDDKIEKIRHDIDAATRLREEAQDKLAQFERKQHEAIGEAEQIIARAHEEAERMAQESAERLQDSLRRSEKLAKERIAQAEAQAIDEVRSKAIELAIEASRKILAEDLSTPKATQLIDDAIKDIETKLH